MGGNGNGAGDGREERFTSGEWRERDRRETEQYIRAREDAARSEARNELLLQQTVAGVGEIKGTLAGVVAVNTSLKTTVEDHADQLSKVWARLDENRSSWSGLVPGIVNQLIGAAIIAGAVATAMVLSKPSDPPAHAATASAPAKPG